MNFSFGAPKQPATTAPATATPGFSLGGATAGAGGGFSFGAAAKPSAPAATGTPGGFSFGGATTSTPAPAGGGFSFGTPAATAAAPAASTAGGAGFTLGGGAPTLGNAAGAGTQTFGFGAKPASTAAAPTTGFGLAKPATAAAAAPLGLAVKPTMALGGAAPTLGLTAAAPAPASSAPPSALSSLLKPTGSAAPTVKTGLSLAMPAKTTAPGLGGTTATAPGLSLGIPNKTAPTGLLGTSTPSLGIPNKTAPTGLLGTSTPSLGLGGKMPTTSTTLPTATAVAQAAVSTGPKMSYQQLEQAINKWTVELEEQERIFLKQATQVNAWDRLLIENGEKITSLHNDMEKVKADQQRLEHELDYIVAQQKELEDMLVPLEETVATQQQGTIYTQHADLERERTYQLAENTDGQLKRMVQDLKDIIDHLNTSNTPMDTNDPMNQIAKILNAHMDSLQWIDQNSVMLQRKVDEVAKQSDVVRRDQERNVHLAFD